MSMRRSLTEIFGVSEFFHRNFVYKHFRGWGPKKSIIFDLFSKIDLRNFDQLGKSVFFETSCFFEKSGKWGVNLARGLQLFSKKNLLMYRTSCVKTRVIGSKLAKL